MFLSITHNDCLSVKFFAALWKADKKQYVKKSTYAAYCLLMQSHLLPELGDKEDVLEEDVQDLVNRKLSAGLGQKTVRDILVVLKMILRTWKRS